MNRQFQSYDAFSSAQKAGAQLNLLKAGHYISAGFVPGLYLTSLGKDAPCHHDITDYLDAAFTLQGSSVVDLEEALQSAAIAIEKQAGSGDLALQLVIDRYPGKPQTVVLLMPGKTIIDDTTGELDLTLIAYSIRGRHSSTIVVKDGVPQMMRGQGTVSSGEGEGDIASALGRIGDAFITDADKLCADREKLSDPEYVITGSDRYVQLMQSYRNKDVSLRDMPEDQQRLLGGVFGGMLEAMKSKLGIPTDIEPITLTGDSLEEVMEDAFRIVGERSSHGPLVAGVVLSEAKATVDLDKSGPGQTINLGPLTDHEGEKVDSTTDAAGTAA